MASCTNTCCPTNVMLLSNVFLFSDSFECRSAVKILYAIITACMKTKLWNWLSWPPPLPPLSISSPNSTFPIKNPTDCKLEIYHNKRLYPNTYCILKSWKKITFILNNKYKNKDKLIPKITRLEEYYFRLFHFRFPLSSILRNKTLVCLH